MIRFLESLDDSVIPCIAYSTILEFNNYDQCKDFITTLPPVNYNTFYYLIAFLRELLKHPANLLTPEKLGIELFDNSILNLIFLALVFSSVLIRMQRNKDSNRFLKDEDENAKKKKADFVLHFLKGENELQVF
jgi:phosphatidylinositol-bisphosphatase